MKPSKDLDEQTEIQIVKGEDIYCTLIKRNGGDSKPCFRCGKRHRGTRKATTQHSNKGER